MISGVSKSNWLWLLVVLTLGFTVGFGCSAESTQSPADSALLATAISEASPYGQQVLADGEVTQAEREGAFLQFASCISKNGMKVESYRLRARGGSNFDISNPPEMPEATALRLQDECLNTEFEPVDAVYVTQHRRSAKEDETFAVEVAKCIIALDGFTNKPYALGTLAHDAPREYAKCVDQLNQ